MVEGRLTLLIDGKVQGVYFRASTVQTARTLGLTGFARNLPDGRVEVVAEGEESALKSLTHWCHQGPPAARVDSVKTIIDAPKGEFSDFEIR